MKKYKIIIILQKANETIYTDNLEKYKNILKINKYKLFQLINSKYKEIKKEV